MPAQPGRRGRGRGHLAGPRRAPDRLHHRLGDFAEINEAYGGFFGDEPPARAAVGVAALPKGALVEIDAILPA